MSSEKSNKYIMDYLDPDTEKARLWERKWTLSKGSDSKFNM